MIKASAIFTDKMILQKNSTVAVFGVTDCSSVKVIWEGQEYKAKMVDETMTVAGVCGKKWVALLKTGEATAIKSGKIAGETKTMTIVGHIEQANVTTLISEKNVESFTDILEFRDILLGEVWLAGGQSNMELELKDSDNGENVAMSSDYEAIRFYNVPKCPVVNDELYKAERNTAWKNVKGEDCKYMSAVAYYFAKKLYETLNVPIGIIDCYWGGTSATCWVDEERLKDVSEIKQYLKEWQDEMDAKSDEQYAEEMADYNAAVEEWQVRLERLRAEKPDVEWVEINKVVGPYPWPLPRGKASPFRPFGLHKSMIKRVAPYGIKGFIYYQAEEDGERAAFYEKLNTAVINQWRRDFDINAYGAGRVVDKFEEKDFYITQLPMFIANEAVDDKQWCILREQQYRCSQINKNVGIAVISDCGEFDNIHPTDKATPGYRLADQVIRRTYGIHCGKSVNSVENGLDISNSGLDNMVCRWIAFGDNTCELEFFGVYDGICYRPTDGKTLTAKAENVLLNDGVVEDGMIYGFEVSNDGVEYYAPSITVNDNMIILQGKDEKAITNVRYAWFNYGVANVYSSRGMPLMPFSYKKD